MRGAGARNITVPRACTRPPRRISVIIIPHSRRTFHSRGWGTLAPQIAIEDARGCNGDDDESHNQHALSRARAMTYFPAFFFVSSYPISLGGMLPGTRNTRCNLERGRVMYHPVASKLPERVCVRARARLETDSGACCNGGTL